MHIRLFGLPLRSPTAFHFRVARAIVWVLLLVQQAFLLGGVSVLLVKWFDGTWQQQGKSGIDLLQTIGALVFFSLAAAVFCGVFFKIMRWQERLRIADRHPVPPSEEERRMPGDPGIQSPVKPPVIVLPQLLPDNLLDGVQNVVIVFLLGLLKAAPIVLLLFVPSILLAYREALSAATIGIALGILALFLRFYLIDFLPRVHFATIDETGISFGRKNVTVLHIPWDQLEDASPCTEPEVLLHGEFLPLLRWPFLPKQLTSTINWSGQIKLVYGGGKLFFFPPLDREEFLRVLEQFRPAPLRPHDGIVASEEPSDGATRDLPVR